MSLVGTRPPTQEEVRLYEARHRMRLATKPGITGMWQVNGRSNVLDFEEVVRLDASYINEWSIWLDLKILLKTVLVVFKKEGYFRYFCVGNGTASVAGLLQDIKFCFEGHPV